MTELYSYFEGLLLRITHYMQVFFLSKNDVMNVTLNVFEMGIFCTGGTGLKCLNRQLMRIV